MFVAYAVYRSNHPEVFLEAHKYLNTTLGLINTIVLLLSSLTMAWAVRCAQLGQQRSLTVCLSITLACASLFLGIKAVEYSHKWGEGLLWAGAYSAETEHAQDVTQHISQALMFLSVPGVLAVIVSAVGVGIAHRVHNVPFRQLWTGLLLTGLAYFLGLGIGQSVEYFGDSKSFHLANVTVSENPSQAALPQSTSMTGVFFSIYYAMTGVHAIHILAGMGAIIWLLRRSLRGDFGCNYFGPVDYVGLYWHLVDLVWIYLFPLLYLIR